MKNNHVTGSRLSVIALSSTFLGIAGAAHAMNMDSTDMEVWEGTGGGPGTLPFVTGGTHNVILSATTLGRFILTMNVSCNGATDYMNCYGTFFNATGILTNYTAQGACLTASFTAVFTSQATGCVTGQAYNLNFFCINQTTKTATNYGTGATAAFTCAA